MSENETKYETFTTVNGTQLDLPYFSDLTEEDARRIKLFYQSIARGWAFEIANRRIEE